jgi:predicted AAA+ superfamily ATPase
MAYIFVYMYQRLISPLLESSFFLFGARGTGKTSWLTGNLSSKDDSIWIDLLDEEQYLLFLRRPQTLLEIIPKNHPKKSVIVIDEVQRVPGLLNYVHKLIEEKKYIFALTGSSARKLKRGGANLLAGRALINKMHPLTSPELGSDFDLIQALNYGTLPSICNKGSLKYKSNYLKSYVQTYLREEIKEEQVVRNLSPFVKFLEIAAQSNGQILNFSNIAQYCGVDSHAIDRYFEILIDTMLGFYLEPYHESVRKRQTQHSKFYFFDLGVKRALEGMLTVPILERGGSSFGDAFEHFFVLELIRLNDYYETDYKFSYLRTGNGIEFDIIIERPGQAKILIEIKSSDFVDEATIKKREKLRQDLLPNEFWIVSREKRKRYIGEATIMPWQQALKTLFTSKSS